MKSKKFVVVISLILIFVSITAFGQSKSYAQMPFYDLRPKELELRSQFTTYYKNSTSERKSNIKLASKQFNGYFLDVGGEFSFNKVVGERAEKRGYKNAKIISNGEFVDGVGGGVCQVSTTLYNAVVLADLSVNEWHRHSLQVSYVLPSFDAMVNSNWADLRFTNNTHNPIVIYTFADDEKITIKIYGERLGCKVERESVVVGSIDALPEEEKIDLLNEYPNLYEGERQVLSYSKKGIISQGYIVKKDKNGKVISRRKIREDKYNAYRGKVIIGRAKKPNEIIE